MHKFEAPPSLVEQEFNNVWNTVLSDLKSQNRTFEDEGTTEEKAREEYRAIADRRVRLGLVLAEIGEKNNIKVTDEEMQRALMERVRQYPGQEKEVWEFYQKNPNALASVRAPLYEEKVVDFLVELAEVTDKAVTTEELYKDEEAPQPARDGAACGRWRTSSARSGDASGALAGAAVTHICGCVGRRPGRAAQREGAGAQRSFAGRTGQDHARSR